MSLIVEQKCCYPGARNNEDYLHQTEHSIIVLDGSTNIFGLNNKIDAAWYVKTFAEQFSLLDNGTTPLLGTLKAVVQRMKAQHLAITGKDPDDVETKTSASIALVLERKGLLHFYSLGDCSIVIEFSCSQKDKEIIHIDDVARLDRDTIKRMTELHKATGLSVLKTRGLEEIQKLLLSNRSKMNRPGGYWILGFDTEAIDHGVYKTYPSKDVKRVILFSDGFNHQKKIILKNDQIDVEELYRELRDYEDRDLECNNFPRLKSHDDATLAVVTVA